MRFQLNYFKRNRFDTKNEKFGAAATAQRQQTSEKYLPESLEMVDELQKTGDIFFPQSWLSATFGNYQDAAAYSINNL